MPVSSGYRKPMSPVKPYARAARPPIVPHHFANYNEVSSEKPFDGGAHFYATTEEARFVNAQADLYNGR